jgi:hypothetical protein
MIGFWRVILVLVVVIDFEALSAGLTIAESLGFAFGLKSGMISWIVRHKSSGYWFWNCISGMGTAGSPLSMGTINANANANQPTSGQATANFDQQGGR